MQRIKAKVYLDENKFIDFETNSFRYPDENGNMVLVDLGVEERVILLYLCRNHDREVNNYEIFKELNGRAFDSKNDVMRPLTRKISALRKTINIDKEYIKSNKNGIFLLHLADSPFEDRGQSGSDLSEKKPISPIPHETTVFFESALSDNTELGKITSIDMAFQGGSMWLYDGRKNAILKKAIENGVKLRIIVNTAQQVEIIASHMRQAGLMYTELDKNASDWCRFMEEHINSIEIRIAQIPILHRIYLINGENNKGWANITYYSYGNDVLKAQCMCFNSKNSEYQLYHDEFNYIWDNASTSYSEFNNHYNNKIPTDTVEMVNKALSCDSPLGKVNGIDISSHSGYYWLTRAEYVELFNKAIGSGIHFRIIINSPAIEESAQYMRQPMREYLKFEDCLKKWLEREKAYPDLIEVKIAEMPLMHCTCIIYGGDNSWLRVRYYTYGNYDVSKDQRICFNSDDAAYKLYHDEFEYVWKLSDSGEDYLKKNPISLP